MALKVIGAGFSRTGTLSMKAALEQLGFAPCYHAAEVVLPRPGWNDGHLDAWHDHYVGGRPVDWRWLLRGYPAAVDVPACLHYRDLMRIFPDAKVVLTTRDPEAWFDSWQAFWSAIDAVRDPRRIVRFHHYLPLVDAILDRHFGGRIERATNIDVYRRHNDAVRRDVPADRLLEFRVTDGWAPLCRFLGVDIPPGPFPHLNEREYTRALLEAALWTHEAIRV